MKINVKEKQPPIVTHEGGRAVRINDEQELRRSVMACLLWEDSFYEDGVAIADRIAALSGSVPPSTLAAIAIEAREVAKLRHVPLLLLAQLCKTGAGTSLVSDTIARVVQRADEISELLAIYWKDGKRPLSAQLKKGLARAFGKFDAYQIAKYNRDSKVTLRDVMFLTHPNPGESNQFIFHGLASKTLASPDTWEVALSAGADKGETFTRLLTEGKLGYLALLRNLRNMVEASVDDRLIIKALIEMKGADRVLPFRYVAAARACPRLEPAIDIALCAAITKLPQLPGRTAVLVDISGSMDTKLSGKSELTRRDAACALASILNCESLDVYAFHDSVFSVPPRRGMAGVDAFQIYGSGGTRLAMAITSVSLTRSYDRLIVITDEQAHDNVEWPVGSRCYCINVGSYKNGVGYGSKITHIDGFSENVIRYIHEYEVAGL